MSLISAALVLEAFAVSLLRYWGITWRRGMQEELGEEWGKGPLFALTTPYFYDNPERPLTDGFRAAGVLTICRSLNQFNVVHDLHLKNTSDLTTLALHEK